MIIAAAPPRVPTGSAGDRCPGVHRTQASERRDPQAEPSSAQRARRSARQRAAGTRGELPRGVAQPLGLRSRGLRRRAAAHEVGAGDAPRGGHAARRRARARTPARAPRRGRPARRSRAAGKASAGISSRARARWPGRGRADHRADVAEPRRRRRRSRRARSTSVGDALPDRAASVELADPRRRPRPGSRCARARSTPAPARPRGRDERLDRVAAHQRVDRDEVGAEARRPARTASPAPPNSDAGVGLGGDVDVAALAVRDHEQARLPVRARRPSRSAAQPGRPSASKRASCGFTATQARRSRVDQRAAVREDRRRRGAAGIGDARRCGRGIGPQRRRIGVEAEDELGLSLGDPRRERVAEARVRVSAPSPRSSGRCPPVNRGTREAAIWIRSPVRGLTPTRAPRSLTWNFPKPGHRHLAAAAQRVLDGRDHGVHGARRVLLGQLRRGRRPGRPARTSSLRPPRSLKRFVRR